MNESAIQVLDYSAIEPDKDAMHVAIVPALASLITAALPFIGWALKCYLLVGISFMVLSWIGFFAGILGIVLGRGHRLAVTAGAIGALINGLMAACVIRIIFIGGIC